MSQTRDRLTAASERSSSFPQASFPQASFPQSSASQTGGPAGPGGLWRTGGAGSADGVLLEKGGYRARLSCSADDLCAARHLRSHCFQTAALDQDRFDSLCKHVLIEEISTGDLVGCFRVMLLEAPGAFELSYSAQFYDLAGLSQFSGKMITGKMMELGRFCIDPVRQDADILRLSWGAVTRLVDQNEVALLFGCSSFVGTNTGPYLEALALLQHRHLAPEDWRPGVKAPQAVRFLDLLKDRPASQKPDLKRAQMQLPPLLRSYLSMGGWVGDHLVIDPDLNTCHVFTGLEVAKVPAARQRLLREVAAAP
jgi:L-ornithine Nalpha-acyltransferase